MTVEALQKRKEELRAQQAQLVANANAINGAIQDCDYWIGQLTAPADAKETVRQAIVATV